MKMSKHRLCDFSAVKKTAKSMNLNLSDFQFAFINVL